MFKLKSNWQFVSTVVVLTLVGLIFGSTPPLALAGPYAYITNFNDNTVSVIDTSTNTVVGMPITVGGSPVGVAVNPAGTRVYVANSVAGTVSVIDTSTNAVVGGPITVGNGPYGVVVNPAGTRVYVTNIGANTVSVIDTSTNTVVGMPITVGGNPIGVAVNPAGTRVYVANRGTGTVSVIDTSTNTKLTDITVGNLPVAFGQFMAWPNKSAAVGGVAERISLTPMQEGQLWLKEYGLIALGCVLAVVGAGALAWRKR